MLKILKNIFILILLFTIVPVKGSDYKLDERRIQRDTMRAKVECSDKFFELLAIKPEMVILDIGTGIGYHACLFAEKLKGTGKVFATETDIDCVKHVETEVYKKKLTNLYPVLVREEGLDEFYSKQKYDLITLIHVEIEDVNYFKKLKEFLKEDGRIIYVYHISMTLFNPYDFTGNFKEFIRELSMEPADSPFSKYLSEATRELIKQNSEISNNEVLLNAIINDFNMMISNKNFSNDFINGTVFKNVNFLKEEAYFAEWSMLWESKNRTNKLLIFQRFRNYFNKDKIFTYNLGLTYKKKFEEAGYKFKKEYKGDIIPFQGILIFTAK
ncbi:hypothetical protein HY745_05990 [Candidatus Desantisbacteria bacterium]|nr:hypothetical protein [Candidatus Desantisbacteria bacterium]